MAAVWLFVLAGFVGLAGLSDAADLYWNGGNPASNPAAGGTANWNAVDAWRSGSSTGPSFTWPAGTGGTDNAFLVGSAGTITLGTSGAVNFTGANLTVATTGYVIRSTNGDRDLVFTGALTFSDNVALTLDLDNTNPSWGFGTIQFATGASLTVKGRAAADNVNEVRLSAAGTISGGAITLEGSGAGPTGFVSTASSGSGGVTLNTNIANSSATSATLLGASIGSLLTYGGQVSGNAGLQISSPQSGGGGVVVLTNANTYTGATYLNTATTGVLRLGAGNALPVGTTVYFGQSSGGGTVVAGGGTIDLNGFNQTVAALDGGGRGVVNTAGSLSTLTLNKASGSHLFSGVIGIPSSTTNLAGANNQIAIVKNGAGTQILSGTNSYAGTTEVNGGTLLVDGVHSGSGVVSVASGATLGGTGALAGATTILTGGRITGGTADTAGTLSFTGDLTAAAGSTWLVDLVQGVAGTADLVDVANDHLTVAGANLLVQFTGVFEANKVYRIANYGTLSGTFSGLGEGAFVDPGSLYQISYGLDTPGAITLKAVPEPGTLSLLGLAAGGYWLRRRILRKMLEARRKTH